MIEKMSKHKFALFSKKTGKLLGEHPSEAAAKKQEAAIEISKARAKGAKIPFPPKK